MQTGAAFLKLAEKHNVPKEIMSRMPTSVDSMSPTNPFLLKLAETPPADPIKAHSIIAIKGNENMDRFPGVAGRVNEV